MSRINIYFESRVLVLTDNLEAEMEQGFDGIHTYSDFAGIKQFVDKFYLNTGIKRAILFSKHLPELFRVFQACFKYVEAAGGVVENVNEEILMIYRNGKWDLPKGKKERKESDEETAVREVAEETGLTNIAVNRFMCDTYHIYEIGEKRFLKRTAWFLMSGNAAGLRPQLEEGITGVEWIKRDNIRSVFSNTFASITEVLTQLN